MTKVKKPAVKAKTVRRGRPPGSKNKKQGLEKQIADWEAEPRQPAVDCVALAQKLQNALAKSYVEVQKLEKKLLDKEQDLDFFTRKSDVLEMQLEIKQRHIEFLEVDLAHRKAMEEGIFRDEDPSV